MGQVAAGQILPRLGGVFGVYVMGGAKIGQHGFVRQQKIQHTGQHFTVSGARDNIIGRHARQRGKPVHKLCVGRQKGQSLQRDNLCLFGVHRLKPSVFARSGNKKGAAKQRLNAVSRDLFDFVFLEFDMLAHNRIVFFHDHFFGHGACVFLRNIIKARAGRAFQFDLNRC